MDFIESIKEAAEKADMKPPGGTGTELPTIPDDDAAAANNGGDDDDDDDDDKKNVIPSISSIPGPTTKTIVHNDVETAKEATENEIRDSFNDLKKTEVAELIGSITDDFCMKIDNKETMESFIKAFFKKINEHFYSDEAEKKKFAIELLDGIVNNKTTVGGATDAAATDAADAAATDAADADATDAADAAAATAIAVAKTTAADAADAADATDAKNTDTAATTDAKNTAAADETTDAAAAESDDDDDDTVKNEIDKDEKPNAKIVLAFLKKEISSLFKGAKPIGDDGKTTPNDRVHQIMQKNIDSILYDTIITKVGEHLNTMNNPREIFFGEDGIGKVISIEHNEQRLTDLKRILNIQLMCNKSIINVEQLNSMELDEYKKNEGFKEFINAIQLPESSNDGEKTENSEESENSKESENNEETKIVKESENNEETKIVKELLETLSELYDVAVHLYELNDEKRDKNDYILERLNLKNNSDSEINGFLADVFKAIQDFFNINSKTGENNPGNNTTTGGSSRKKKMRKTKKIKSKSKRRTR